MKDNDLTINVFNKELIQKPKILTLTDKWTE